MPYARWTQYAPGERVAHEALGEGDAYGKAVMFRGPAERPVGYVALVDADRIRLIAPQGELSADWRSITAVEVAPKGFLGRSKWVRFSAINGCGLDGAVLSMRTALAKAIATQASAFDPNEASSAVHGTAPRRDQSRIAGQAARLLHEPWQLVDGKDAITLVDDEVAFAFPGVHVYAIARCRECDAVVFDCGNGVLLSRTSDRIRPRRDHVYKPSHLSRS